MPRYREPYSIIKRPDSPYYYFKLGSWKKYRTTRCTTAEEAEKVVHAAYLESLVVPTGPLLREYAEPYFIEVIKIQF